LLVKFSYTLIFKYASIHVPEILRGGKSLGVYADTSPLQPSGDYSNGLANCGYYEISGYWHALSMTMSAPQVGE
jgi:hypothetical protein